MSTNACIKLLDQPASLEQSMALKGFRLVVPRDSDIVRLAITVGADIVWLEMAAERLESEDSFETWLFKHQADAERDSVALAFLYKKPSRRYRQFWKWCYDQDDVRFVKSGAIADAILGKGGKVKSLLDTSGIEIEKVRIEVREQSRDPQRQARNDQRKPLPSLKQPPTEARQTIEETFLPAERIPLSGDVDGWMDAAPSERTQFRKGYRTGDGKMTTYVSAETEHVCGLVVANADKSSKAKGAGKHKNDFKNCK